MWIMHSIWHCALFICQMISKKTQQQINQQQIEYAVCTYSVQCILCARLPISIVFNMKYVNWRYKVHWFCAIDLVAFLQLHCISARKKCTFFCLKRTHFKWVNCHKIHFKKFSASIKLCAQSIHFRLYINHSSSLLIFFFSSTFHFTKAVTRWRINVI